MQRFHEIKNWAVDHVREKAQSLKIPFKNGSEPLYSLLLVTGDKRGAGTNANVFVTIHSKNKCSRTIKADHFFKDDNERGSVTRVDFGNETGIEPPFESVEIWRDNFGGFSLPPLLNNLMFGDRNKNSSYWFLDKITIKSLSDKDGQWVFPVHRWISEGLHYFIPLYDCLLPQNDLSRIEFRQEEINNNKKSYVLCQKIVGGPVQVKELPTNEQFSEKFYWTFVEKKTCLMASSKLINWTTSSWRSIENLQEIFKLGFDPPEAIEVWKEDWWFGLQRLQGVDSTILKLCETLPENVQIPDCIEKLLNGRNFEDALRQKKIFICNLSILHNLPCKDGREVAAPIALFHLNPHNELLPISIQLRQEKSDDNPVYTPLDRENTWLLAKMYYNNAEAQWHQALTHLGMTHFLMEGVCGVTRRCLSVSHPISRLLSPHFLYLIAINKRGEEKLVNTGGWVDSTMTQGTEGMFKLMAKGIKNWTFKNTDPRYEIGKRGLLESRILPYYPYRDDAICLYMVIRTYVEKIVNRYYVNYDSIINDWEINEFRKELCLPPPKGIGLKGVPGSDAKGFEAVEEIVDTLTGIISTCTIGHASANSQQYGQYAFVPNYPGLLTKDPPVEKLCYTEQELLSLLPSKSAILDTIVITNLLSSPITNVLGDFEVQYLFHPEDVKAVESFRSDLKTLSSEIQRRNNNRILTYEDLDPNFVPNSICI